MVSIPDAAPRQAMLRRLLPPWGHKAACRGKAINQAPWEAMFRDEVGHKRNIGDYVWQDGAIEAMRTCAGCPVKTECLAYGFEVNRSPLQQFGIFGGVPGKIREALGTDPCPTCKGTGYLDEVLGIAYEEYRWVHTKTETVDVLDDKGSPLLDDQGGHVTEARERSLPGFPCSDCDARGRVVSPERLTRCSDWATFWAAADRREPVRLSLVQEEAM